jgi:hypothetical protein
VKEYYFHLDSTPTHSYMKFLHKYPQRAYPYGQLLLHSRGNRLGKIPDGFDLLRAVQR